MALPNDLISQFVKATKDTSEKKSEKFVYGTIVEYEGSKYMKIDGSELLTPISSVTSIGDGERVTGMIKDHALTVTGNLTSPSVRSLEMEGMQIEIDNVVNEISEFEIVIADKVSTEELNALTGRIDTLESDNVIVRDTLTAQNADISNLQADNATIHGTLTAQNADITDLQAENATIEGKLTARDADIESLQADNVLIRDTLTAQNADISNLQADNATIHGTLTAQNAVINGRLSATNLEAKFANIDFANIGMAAIEELFSKSGIIGDLVVGETSITGTLVGVTIKGDLVEAGTLVADKLVVRGEDGLLYKLNLEFGNITGTEQVPDDALHGSIIAAKSITAEKVNVKDLVAFGATIGGFHLTDDSIFSGVKESVDNTTRGIYMDSDGQIAFGDANNFVKFYKDSNGSYKLAISAESLVFGSGRTDIETELDNLKDEIVTNLRIDSSRGTVFKNDAVSTVLSVVIYRGSKRITDIDSLHDAMGSGAYLQWKWQRMGDNAFGVISASDERIGNGGFTFTLTPDDVDTKVTFMCELIA